MMLNWNESAATVLADVPYQVIQSGGQITDEILSIVAYPATGLPAALDALLITSDLQGRGRLFEPGRTRLRQRVPPHEADHRLLGLIVAETIAKLSASSMLPPADRLGVVLPGDLFAREDLSRRGGLGDVRPVWQAFRDVSRWVMGVAGNHDTFGTPREYESFRKSPRIDVLDGNVLPRDGIRFGGVSGIIGPAGRPNRRSEEEFCQRLRHVIGQQPDVIVLHEGPSAIERPGNPMLRELFEQSRRTLILCGHCHWVSAFGELGNGTQIINTDARAIILRRE